MDNPDPDSSLLIAALVLNNTALPAWQAPLGFYLLSILLMGILLLLSAIVSGSEVSLFSLSPEELEHCQQSNTPTDRRIVALLEQPRLLLATILIFNNLINVSIVTLSTFITWQIVGSKTPEGVVVLGLTTTVTLLILFFGELLPKVYANRWRLSFARTVTPLIGLAVTAFKPLSFLLMSMTHLIEKRVQHKGYRFSTDELDTAIQMTTDKASEKEREILKGLVNFSHLTAKQIMTARLNIVSLSKEASFAEVLESIKEHGYSRVPVYGDTIDRIEGILYIKDLLEHLDQPPLFDWTSLLRPSYFIPEQKRIDKLLKDFQEKRVHMAIVVDEYGGTVGLVTMEDIIEEIVGEINDESDEADKDRLFIKESDHSFLFRSHIPLVDFAKVVGVESHYFDRAKGDSESLGGLLIEMSSGLPKLGDAISFEQFVFTVVSVDSKKIKAIRVQIQEKQNAHEKR
ncbi:gliding motility-associated protein GldE [Eisenibacter elegans]|uniref:gliding motility-associated protein GldE n=1 Tax=Eisenibacter elegans TaxID=997 RepID=UPI0004101B21|nr:gliding motility-associated protein GldE [Eisenibacter elegans]